MFVVVTGKNLLDQFKDKLHFYKYDEIGKATWRYFCKFYCILVLYLCRSPDLFPQNSSPLTENTETGSEARHSGQGSTTDTALEVDAINELSEKTVKKKENLKYNR